MGFKGGASSDAESSDAACAPIDTANKIHNSLFLIDIPSFSEAKFYQFIWK